MRFIAIVPFLIRLPLLIPLELAKRALVLLAMLCQQVIDILLVTLPGWSEAQAKAEAQSVPETQ